MKLLATCFSLLLLVGCVEDAPPAKRWTMQHKAMTEEEISRIDSHVKEILSHAPQHLSGNDQDLDDYARVVYNGAVNNLTRPRMFEEVYVNEWWQATGAWRECTQEELKSN